MTLKARKNGYGPQAELDGWARLAAAVVTQAVADAALGDPLTALDACLFLAGDAQFFLEVAGLDLNPKALLRSGRLRRRLPDQLHEYKQGVNANV